MIVLVEDFPCQNENQARAKEAFYIQNNPCVNKNIPGRTQKESVKVYHNNHKIEIREYHNTYINDNRNKWNKYMREYRAN